MTKFKKALIKRLETIKGKRSIADWARDLGVNHPRLSRYFRGEATPSAETLCLIAEKENVNIHWLLTGIGDIHLPPCSAESVQEGLRHIPVAARISQGKGGGLRWQKEDKQTIGLEAATAIRVEDGSLEPYAQVGQYLVVKPDADLKDGDLAILRIRRKGFFFKQVFILTRGRVELQSVDRLKPAPSMTVATKDILRQYKIIGIISG